jgi:hypothetical protein
MYNDNFESEKAPLNNEDSKYNVTKYSLIFIIIIIIITITNYN